MAANGIGGSEEIDIATVFQAKPAAQFDSGKREITHGDIGLADTCEGFFERLFVHRSHSIYTKTAPWEGRNELSGDEQMRVVRNSFDMEKKPKQPAFITAECGS